ncbi:hypothetical protein Patl1_27283 [Pistacia atlantica]|uniref:Uncharacterized protein n=1 Tax=Pistacia atlantica TaxID=434234 RepID=A0ACC1BG60_9ROSI|nr:hypothetical protein Patl1_27283 [Pistacia atlantica]
MRQAGSVLPTLFKAEKVFYIFITCTTNQSIQMPLTKTVKSLAKGILVNSFMEMEGEVLKTLMGEPGYPPIYPIGPLIWA